MVKFSRGFQRIAIPFVSLYMHIFYHLEIEGRENIPQGGCVVCANHSQNLDPPLAAVALTGKHNIAAMAKKELFSIKGLGPLITLLGAFPIDRDKADIKAIKYSLSAVKNGRKLLIFPEGTRHHGEGSSAKEGAAMLALKTHAPVLPVYISENKTRFGKAKIIIGKPFMPEAAHGDKDAYQRIADDILKRIYELSQPEGKQNAG